MFCPKCGNEIADRSTFCASCGVKLLQPEITEADDLLEGVQRPSPGIWLCNDGKYRWFYELNMWKNPTIFISVLRVFGMTAVILLLIFCVISIFTDGIDGLVNMLKLFTDNPIPILLFLIFFIVLIIMSYGILAIMYGGKYIVLFEMDDKGIRHSQQSGQFKKAQAIAWVSTFASVARGDVIGGIGRGLYLGTNNSTYTTFADTTKCRARRKLRDIQLSEGLMQNHIYASDEDFEFVLNYITERIPERA